MATKTASAPTKLKLNDLLTALDDAFSVAQDKNEALAQAHSAQSAALTAAQEVFDAVKADHQSRVQAAATEAETARQALEKAKADVNERTGLLTGSTDARVSVR